MRIACLLMAPVLFGVSACAKPITDIQSPDYNTRQKACLHFYRNASADEVQELIGLLGKATNIAVRIACIDALGYAGASNAVPALIEALDIPQWHIRRSTVNALGRIADPRAIDPLIRILLETPTDPNLSEGRRCAVNAFVNLKSEKVVPVLMHMLVDNPGKNESDRIDFTTALLAALGAQKDDSAIPEIAKLLDGRAGSQAAGAIGNIVGVSFLDGGEPFGMPLPSPAKAKEWLEQHPEILTPKKDKNR